jgi:hypothetical protein
MSEENKLFVIEAPVSERTREFFETAAGRSKNLTAAAADALREVANGGVLLTRKDISEIEQSTGVKLRTAAQVRRNIERTSKTKDGKMSLTWNPDPVYNAQLKEMAEMRGSTVYDILQDCMDWVIGEGWPFDLNPEPVDLKVTPHQASYLRSLMDIEDDTPLRGADIIGFLRETVGETSGEMEAA